MAGSEEQDSLAAEVYLIHDAALEPEVMAELSALAAITFLPWAERDTPPAEARVLFYLGDEQIRDLAIMGLERQWEGPISLAGLPRRPLRDTHPIHRWGLVRPR